MWVGFLAYLGVLAMAARLGRQLVWGTIVVLIVAFACVPPLLSHDVYSYVDYARLDVLYGFSPYVHPPVVVSDDPAFAQVTWPNTKSIYGPLFTLATFPLARLPVDVAVYVLKATSAAAVLAIAVVVARLAPARGVDPLRAAAFVALNPLVLVHVVGGGHNDSLAVLLMTLGIAAMLSAREISAGISFVAAFAVKSAAAAIVPFALMGALRRKRLLLSSLVAAVVMSAVAYLAFDWQWLSSFELAAAKQKLTSHLSIPVTTARLTGFDEMTVRIAALLLYSNVVLVLFDWVRRGGDWLRAAAWATFGLLLATAWLLPWYLLWPLPAAALSRDRVLQLLILALTAYQLGARIPL